MLSPDEDRKFGPPGGDDEAADHEVETREFLDRSEFCASCHTIIHPLNGLRLEHTYDEWKKSIYAEKGIQCQDCHMRSVEDAVKVAETLDARGGDRPVGADGRRARDPSPLLRGRQRQRGSARRQSGDAPWPKRG